MPIYDEYAAVYDRSGQLAFSLRMIPYLQSLLSRHAVGGKTLLELACGTGTVAIAFAAEGWRVYAVDGSAQMLAQARAKAERDDLALFWSQQDMRRFVLPERVYVATCLYDSLNYMLTDTDLRAVFRAVFRALQPGGLFLFDMNTACAFERVWNDQIYFTDSDDLSVILQCRYDARQQRTSVTVTCFERQGELYRKLVETHTEQAYPDEQIATLLTDVGFQVQARYACFTQVEPTADAMRIMWVARRPENTGDHA
ncbi:MAG: class I SAM-dependent methyltransferase [Chloroflexi bacterium]|nr:class I SAM-dependent methyltransferase [Chloroflexota bacterium]